MESLGSHTFAGGLKRNNGGSKRDAEKRSQCTAKRMPRYPNIRVGIHVRQIVVQILVQQNPVSTPLAEE